MREALRIALRRSAPNEIPIAGVGVDKRNYFLAHFKCGKHGSFSPQRLSRYGVDGIWHNVGDDASFEASVPNQMLSLCAIEINLYRGKLGLRYSSALEFIVHHYTLFPQLKIWSDQVAQYFFNRRRLVRRERIDILRSIVDESLDRGDFYTNLFRVAQAFHGPRWSEHPENVRLRRYYGFLLDSLVESGDLVGRQPLNYQLAPKALATIAQFEEDDRRHCDLVRLQIVLVFLTGALVIVGLVQAAVGYFGH